jgi:7-carboxy-7-deazaguanine synthase
MKGKISEVFESVQGEGVYFGEKQLFVRFFGCNLDCKYCDTKLDYFTEYGPQELLEELKLYHDKYHSVSFTGGEPLLQKDFLKEILILTRHAGFKNYLETNGTLPEALKEVIDYVDIVAMDLKLPSSTDLKDFWDKHRQFLEIASTKEVFLKTVVCISTRDEELREAIKLIKEINRSAVLVLQPNSFENNAELKEKLKLCQGICEQERLTTCIIPQMHRAMGMK